MQAQYPQLPQVQSIPSSLPSSTLGQSLNNYSPVHHNHQLNQNQVPLGPVGQQPSSSTSTSSSSISSSNNMLNSSASNHVPLNNGPSSLPQQQPTHQYQQLNNLIPSQNANAINGLNHSNQNGSSTFSQQVNDYVVHQQQGINNGIYPNLPQSSTSTSQQQQQQPKSNNNIPMMPILRPPPAPITSTSTPTSSSNYVNQNQSQNNPPNSSQQINSKYPQYPTIQPTTQLQQPPPINNQFQNIPPPAQQQQYSSTATSATSNLNYPQMNYQNNHIGPISQQSQPPLPPPSAYSSAPSAPSIPNQNHYLPPSNNQNYVNNQSNQYPQQNMYPPKVYNNTIQPPQQQQQYVGQGQNQQPNVNSIANQFGGLSVSQQGFSQLMGQNCIDLLKTRNILPPSGVKPPDIRFQHEYMNNINCNPDLFRCTLTKIPESKGLLQKSRLPLGILIHPFKDLTQLPVIQCSTIVRCRTCRTYINPFVYFVDQRRWKCNLCYRVNDIPEEFQYDPVTKTYGDPSRRPEVRSSTIEFLAPADYMVRPPQAAVYLFLFDVSSPAVDSGYLKTACDSLLEHIDSLPGDSRSQIGFITYDSSVHFYNLSEKLSQPRQLVVCDIDDIFIPFPENLLVSLTENRSLIRQLLTNLPTRFLENSENSSCLGAALQAAHKLLAPIGGRITIFQCILPTIGPGALAPREHISKSTKDLTQALNPSTDFYKKLALDCSTQYIAVDLFFLNYNYVDIASISCIAKYSGGQVLHFPRYHSLENPQQSYLFEQGLGRYLSRKIGFEAVMRVRCTRGLSIHTFHGNLFVRSTDLLSLPNCNPDSAFGMQVSIDETLSDFQSVCFQAALLYTSSKGERRIRVHTLCLPVAGNVNDIITSADQQCIIGLLAKMAVDRSLSSNLNDAREAFINAVVDVLSAYASTQNSVPNLSLLAPSVLQMLPLYTHAMLRSIGFRNDLKVQLDERVQFMNDMKTFPLYLLIQSVYPDLYPLHGVEQIELVPDLDEEVPDFPRLHLCSDRIDAFGVYLMDCPDLILVYVCRSVSAQFCQDVFGVNNYFNLNEMREFPELDTICSTRIRNFVNGLQQLKPFSAPIRIVRDDSKERMLFVNRLVEDRSEYSVSYFEFLQQLKNMVK